MEVRMLLLVVFLLVLRGVSASKDRICTRRMCVDVLQEIEPDFSFLGISDVYETSVAGRGFFGSAVRARDILVPSRMYVVKRIAKIIPSKLLSGKRDAYFGRLFASEFCQCFLDDGSSVPVACGLASDTSQLVRFVDQDEDDHYFYIFFRDEGDSLANKLKTHTSMDFKSSVSVQLMKAVKALHDRGVYHRDLKPDNIVLSSAMELRLIDFGSAINAQSVRDEELYPDGPLRIGETDLRYMGPEMLKPVQGFSLDEGEKFDIWSAGVTLLELFTGRRDICYFHGTRGRGFFPPLRVCSERLVKTPPSGFPDDEIALMVETMLSWEPSSRPTSTEVLDVLLNKFNETILSSTVRNLSGSVPLEKCLLLAYSTRRCHFRNVLKAFEEAQTEFLHDASFFKMDVDQNNYYPIKAMPSVLFTMRAVNQSSVSLLGAQPWRALVISWLKFFEIPRSTTMSFEAALLLVCALRVYKLSLSCNYSLV